MDPELQKRIDEAKAAGYSDEEIAKVLGTAAPTPTATLPQAPAVPILSAEEKAAYQLADQQTADRNTGENWNTFGAGVAAAGSAGLGTYGAYKGLEALGKRIIQPVAPGPIPPQASAPTGGSGAYSGQGANMPRGPIAPQQTMINQVRQQAANRIIGMGGATAVPAGVALGGAAATGIAGGQMAAMTPEQRKAYYDNMMLGAMGGDAALGAAIMNRGQ